MSNVSFVKDKRSHNWVYRYFLMVCILQKIEDGVRFYKFVHYRLLHFYKLNKIAAQDYGLIEKSKEDEPDQDGTKDEIRSIQEGYALEDVSHLNLAESRNLKSASTNRSNTKNKSILKAERALETKTQKNEVRFEKLPDKNKISQQSSNLFINEKIQNKDPNEANYRPDVKTGNSSNDLEKHSVRVITLIPKDMEHFGIKKFERFDTKKYDRQREKIFTDNSTNSKASWTRDAKFETSRPKGSALSDEKWNYLNTEESFHPNSAENNVAQLAESLKRPLKPKIESVQQQNKLPKLKFLKSQDFHSESLTDYKQSSANSDSAYFDSDYAKVEMLRLRPKQNGGFAENLQSTKKERKELRSQMPNQTAIYNFEEKEPYNPKKYDYSNILFKETTNLNRKDNNFLKPTSFKGLPSAEYRNEINTQRDPNVSTKTKPNDNLKKRNWNLLDFCIYLSDQKSFFHKIQNKIKTDCPKSLNKITFSHLGICQSLSSEGPKHIL
ncbi:hypothetical protein BpHYR1_049654 [Brachionus plicatilis]|uniref:Uncharacterized protein n=1 Tax=Brachionus plicatilis TaxID=10195 RepID=A0A3M7R5W2_BRAPC|nr:hypothetical protein BpHYR1_049654 [Brachionus plicatilis]